MKSKVSSRRILIVGAVVAVVAILATAVTLLLSSTDEAPSTAPAEATADSLKAVLQDYVDAFAAADYDKALAMTCGAMNESFTRGGRDNVVKQMKDLQREEGSARVTELSKPEIHDSRAVAIAKLTFDKTQQSDSRLYTFIRNEPGWQICQEAPAA